MEDWKKKFRKEFPASERLAWDENNGEFKIVEDLIFCNKDELEAFIEQTIQEIISDVPLIPADSNPFRKGEIDPGAMNGWDVAYVSQMDLLEAWKESLLKGE